MITIITFLLTSFVVWIYSFFYEMEIDTIVIFALLTSIAVSLPYYCNKILKTLEGIKDKFEEKETEEE